VLLTEGGWDPLTGQKNEQLKAVLPDGREEVEKRGKKTVERKIEIGLKKENKGS